MKSKLKLKHVGLDCRHCPACQADEQKWARWDREAQQQRDGTGQRQACFQPRPKPYKPALRPSVRAPLPACPIMDGREARHIKDDVPRNDKERFQANIARFSKLNDTELRMIAMQRTGPESKAARHLIEWRPSRTQ